MERDRSMPSCDVFLGIDLGTTSVKATLVDEGWDVVGQRRVEYRIYQPRPLRAEQDPWDWWAATCRVVKELMETASTEAKQVRAVGVSSQAPCLLGVDRHGLPTGNAMIWMDRRASEECSDLTETLGDGEIWRISGNRIDPYYMLPKLLWEMKHRRERYERTYKYIQANGWIIFQLTGEYTADLSHAALTQLYNVYETRWETSLIQELGISLDKLPDIFECMETVGTISPLAAHRLGLMTGTPVIAGAIDGATAPLGLKMVQANQAFEMSGQSSGVGVILDNPCSQPNLALLKHAIDGKWILKGSMSVSGGSLQWWRDRIDERPEDTAAYEYYDKLAATVPPGSGGVIYLPYLAGERAPLWDDNARGVFFGLHLQTGKAEMVRAIMEGAAYGLKSIVEEFRAAGFEIQGLLGTGGGYASEEWSQIKADVLETHIGVAYGGLETASLGAAYLALMHDRKLGSHHIPEVAVGREYSPNEQNRQMHRRYYSIFRRLYTDNRELFKTLASGGEAN